MSFLRWLVRMDRGRSMDEPAGRLEHSASVGDEATGMEDFDVSALAPTRITDVSDSSIEALEPSLETLRAELAVLVAERQLMASAVTSLFRDWFGTAHAVALSELEERIDSLRRTDVGEPPA